MERTAQLETTIIPSSRKSRSATRRKLRCGEEARLRAMTRAMPDLVFVVDEDGRYREVLATGRDIGSTPHARKVPAPIRVNYSAKSTRRKWRRFSSTSSCGR